MGFGGSRVFSAVDPSYSEGVSEGVSVRLLQDGETIKASVSRNLFDVEPSTRWRYYCLVASQDAFGTDNYRPVLEEAGPWNFGGGSGTQFTPRVIDMLAPSDGKYSQESQLGSARPDEGIYAVIYPVGGRSYRGVLAAAVLILILLLCSAILILRILAHRRSAKP